MTSFQHSRIGGSTPIDKFVIGGQEVAERIKDGYMIITF